MVITLIFCCFCVGFVLGDCALSVRISWRSLHGEPFAELERSRVAPWLVNAMTVAAIVLWFLGFSQSS
jgi:hypothetical protein